VKIHASMNRLLPALLLAAAWLLGPATALAGPEAAPDKGDTAWVLTSTMLVILMTIPGLALFYGGMVRSKNVLSVFMQVFMTFCLIALLWAIYGYSLAFSGSGAFIGGFDRLFMQGMTPLTRWPRPSPRAGLHSRVRLLCLPAHLRLHHALPDVGAFRRAHQVFGAVLLFVVFWFTFAYLPIAHMVWFWAGPDAYTRCRGRGGGRAQQPDSSSRRARWISPAAPWCTSMRASPASSAALFVGKRVGYGRVAMPPHNLPMVMIGTSLLWVGWFGFNAGSNLEANGLTAQVIVNTILATSAAALAWSFAEWLHRGTPTVLGAASGAVAGLVAITPACGWVGPMGAICHRLDRPASSACWPSPGSRRSLGYDDSLDVFGVHCVGGIIGALLTAVFCDPALGGTGVYDYSIANATAEYSIAWPSSTAQLWAVLARPSSGRGALSPWPVLRSSTASIGLRVSGRRGACRAWIIVSHGESAYT
jgi:Amt family ammonium transporter